MAMSESRRRRQLAAVGGDLLWVRRDGDRLIGAVRFTNRGELNAKRQQLTREGWHVVTDGVTATAAVDV